MQIDIPGDGSMDLDHLVLDMNGTITHRGELIHGVSERMDRLRGRLTIDLLTADTFGSADQVSRAIGARLTRIETASDKASFLHALGANNTVAIGNGRNDEAMLRAARLAIAVIGPEAAWLWTVHFATVVCTSILDALDLLIEPRLLVATLRR